MKMTCTLHACVSEQEYKNLKDIALHGRENLRGYSTIASFFRGCLRLCPQQRPLWGSREPATRQLSLLVPLAYKEIIEQICEANHQSVSSWIRGILAWGSKRYIENEHNELWPEYWSRSES